MISPYLASTATVVSELHYSPGECENRESPEEGVKYIVLEV